MRWRVEMVRAFFQDESGASAIEYGLLVAFIAVIIINAVSMLGSYISTIFINEANAISAAS